MIPAVTSRLHAPLLRGRPPTAGPDQSVGTGSRPALHVGNLFCQQRQRLHEAPCYSQTHRPLPALKPPGRPHTTFALPQRRARRVLLQHNEGKGTRAGEAAQLPVFVELLADLASVCLHLSMENKWKLGSLPRHECLT